MITPVSYVVGISLWFILSRVFFLKEKARECQPFENIKITVY